MAHTCTINEPQKQDESFLRRVCERMQGWTLVSNDNPLSLHYFRSPVAIKTEQERQRKVTCFAIHPFSEFRKWFDLCLIYLYASSLITKPLQYGFPRRRYYRGEDSFYIRYTEITHFLFLLHIPLNFFCGFVGSNSNVVELRPGMMAKNYVFSPYFFCDVISSVPKVVLYNIPDFGGGVRLCRGIVNMCAFFRIVRIVSLIRLIGRVSCYMRSNSRSALFLLYTFVIILNVIHWMACLQFGVPRFIRSYILQRNVNETWFVRAGLMNKTLYMQYFNSFFKSSAYILGVRITKVFEERLPEEYIIGVITYFVGKIIVGFVWIVLAMAILNSRTMDIKFLELINQLDEYMNRRQLPLKLKERICHYYHYKYRSKYVNEDLVTGMLSNNLKKEVNLHICKSLIQKVALFATLDPTEINNLVQYLIPEIFLPNDTIIHHGTYGDAMYFLSSGTVAVYTYSGKEICHLQDGAYFGEIALLLKAQTRTATVVAIETCQVFRLGRRKFEKSLLKNKRVLEKMLAVVSQRIEETTWIEEQYKKMLFEQTFQGKNA